MYPHSLASRLAVQRQTEAKAAQSAGEATAGQKMAGSQLTMDTEDVWNLWNISLRLEMLCSSLENPGCVELKPPETALLERMKSRGGEITDRFLINFVEHQISRIEVRPNTAVNLYILANSTNSLVRPLWLFVTVYGPSAHNPFSKKPATWATSSPNSTPSSSG